MVLLTSFRPPRATASSPPPACRAHATASLLAARALATGSSLAARAHATFPPPTRRAHATIARWRPRTRSPPPPGSPPVRAPPPFPPLAAHHRLLPARCSLPHPRHSPGLAAQPVHHGARESHHGLLPSSPTPAARWSRARRGSALGPTRQRRLGSRPRCVRG
ncbi:hypothetical protein PVAP13_6NG268993 [Panicum virgatum]|uniref:Uncharacterized protein n=1 Tax=Panicum virgatum TaxID=38727 RepID=A0A8T0R412_PANVG|nr:hypothetical protein PVAP13_6NG268993 [Panicum virgatum]